jgi:hypothetical protein
LLLGLTIQSLTTNPSNPLKVQEKYKRELAKFQLFANSLATQPAAEIDIKAYAKHILIQGGRDDKRELLELLTTELYLHNRTIRLERVPAA